MENPDGGSAQTTTAPAKSKAKNKGKMINIFDDKVNWAEEMEEAASNMPMTTAIEVKTRITSHQRISLPTAPKASRGEVIIDMESLPAEPPYTAYMGNIAYNANETTIQNFFRGLQIVNIRMMNENGKPRGYCYIEFASRIDLCEALKLNNESLLNRQVKIDLAGQQNDRKKSYEYQQSNSRDQGGSRQQSQRYNSGGESNSGDWRSTEPRVYEPAPPSRVGPPELSPYASPPSMPVVGRPPVPPAAYNVNSRYDRPDYGYGGPLPPPLSRGSAPYGPPNAPGACYYPPYPDQQPPMRHAPDQQQNYYNGDNRKKGGDGYGRYNTIGGSRGSMRERGGYDAGYESERDMDYRYRQQQGGMPDYQGPGGRVGPRGGSSGYPMMRAGSQGSYGGYASDTDGYQQHQRQKGGAAYYEGGRGGGGNYVYPYPSQPQQHHFQMYQDLEPPTSGRHSANRDYAGYAPPPGGNVEQRGPQPRRTHRTSTASTVSVDENSEDFPKSRPKLQLQPRTRPIAELPAPLEKSSSGIFGNAKPIDTRQKDAEIEEKIKKQEEEAKKRLVSESTSEAGRVGGSRRHTSENSARSSPVEDPKPSEPENRKTSAHVQILRRSASNQSEHVESSPTTPKAGDDAPSSEVFNVNGEKKTAQNKNGGTKTAETAKESRAVYRRESGDKHGGNRRDHGEGRRGGHNRGSMRAERPPRFQQDPGVERRGSQDSLVFTRGGRGRVKREGGIGRGRSFDEGDGAYREKQQYRTTKPAPAPGPAAAAPVGGNPPSSHSNNSHRRHSNRSQHEKNNHRKSSAPVATTEATPSVEAKPSDVDSAATGDVAVDLPPAVPPPVQLPRKKSKDKVLEKKASPPLVREIVDDTPNYTNANKFSLLQSMADDE